jgi:predicted DsbA family dithiol-disulfide isomerase
MMKIQVVQDLICPWCYIGHHNLDQAVKEWTAGKDVPVEIEWLPYQLDPLEPGAPQEDFRERFIKRKGMAPEQVEGMFDRVTQAGKSVGIDFRFDKVTVAVDTLPGHVAIAATPVEKQAALVAGFHKAYFEEGRDVGQTAEILAIAAAAGLDEVELEYVRQAIADPESVAVVQDLIRQVQAAGISGVPYFIIDGQIGVSGGQPVQVFKQVFDQATAATVS